MVMQEYLLDVETSGRVCPNCSRHDEDFINEVDKYGKSWNEVSEGCHCDRCGFPFEVA